MLPFWGNYVAECKHNGDLAKLYFAFCLMAWGGGQWPAVVNSVTNSRVPQKAGNPVIS